MADSNVIAYRTGPSPERVALLEQLALEVYQRALSGAFQAVIGHALRLKMEERLDVGTLTEICARANDRLRRVARCRRAETDGILRHWLTR